MPGLPFALLIRYTKCIVNDRQTQIISAWLGTGSINIFGRPFAGKDTQAQKLAALFGATVLGGGDILRASIIPDEVLAALKRGELIPSQAYVDIVLPYLSKPELRLQPLILSSVGRWIGEEEGVIAALDSANHPLKATIYLDLDETTVHRRWDALEHHDDRGGRYDDTAEILSTRLVEFKEKTLPVIEAYRERGLLETIDASGSQEEVLERIITALIKRVT